MGTKRWGTSLGRCVLAGAVGALLPAAAMADNTCNGFIDVDYVGAPPVTPIGDMLHHQERPPPVLPEDGRHQQSVRTAREQDHPVRRAVRALDHPVS